MKLPQHLLMLVLYLFLSIVSFNSTVVAAVKDGAESESASSVVSSRMLQEQQQQQQIVPTLVPSIIPTLTVIPTPILTVETITGPTPEPTISPTFQPITPQYDDDFLNVPTTTTDDDNNSSNDPDEPTEVPTSILIAAPTLSSPSSFLETNEPSFVPSFGPSNVPTLYIVDTIVPAVATKKPVMIKIPKTKSPIMRQPTKKPTKPSIPTNTVQQQPTTKATASISPKPVVLPLSMKPTLKATSSISPKPIASPFSKVPSFRATASISPKPKVAPSSKIPTTKGSATFIPTLVNTNSTNSSYSICYVCNNDITQEVEKNDITNIYIMDINIECRNLYNVAITGLLPSKFCSTATQLVSSKCSCVYIRNKQNQTTTTTNTKAPISTTQTKPPTPIVPVSSSPVVSKPPQQQQQPTTNGSNIFNRSNRPTKLLSETSSPIPSIVQSDTPSYIPSNVPSTIPSVVPTQFIIDATTTTAPNTTASTNITNENNLNNRNVTSDSFIIFIGSQHSSVQCALTFVSSVAIFVLLCW